MSIVSVMPSNYLILCHPLLLLPPIPPIVRVFSDESVETINAGEDVVKGESLYTADRNVKRYSHYGQQYRGSLKT